MSTILAYTSPAIGHLFPMTPLLLELARRGHDVHVRTLPERVGTLRDLGLHAAPIDPAVQDVRHHDWTARGARAALHHAAAVFGERGRVDAPDLARALDEVRPDAVVVDINCWGAAAAAEAWGGPWATFSPYVPALTSPGTPPFGPGVAPLSGPLGRARDAVLRRLVLGAVEGTMLPPLNALRREVGVEAVGTADEMFRRAPLMLVTTAKPFEYATTDWGPDVVMVGACPWEPPQATPDWLHAVDAPVVLVTTSSEFQDDGVLVRTALDALADEAVHVVATLPAGGPAPVVPRNATVVDFVPHGPVLERAVVAVTHGGMGATQKALARGIPVCVVPFGRDQHEVARRVEVSGAGTRLPAKRLRADRLREAVRTARTLTAGAERVARGYAAAGGAATGADAVEQRLLVGLTT